MRNEQNRYDLAHVEKKCIYTKTTLLQNEQKAPILLMSSSIAKREAFIIPLLKIEILEKTAIIIIAAKRKTGFQKAVHQKILTKFCTFRSSGY